MNEFSLTFGSDLIVSIAIAILGGVAVKVWEVINEVLPAKRLWRLKSPEKVIICVSADSQEEIDYPLRSGSGGGQIRALGLIQKSIERAYSPPDLVKNILLSTDQLGRHIERDLIVLGGPEFNQMTKKLLSEIQNSPIRQSNHIITWHETNVEKVFESEYERERIIKDYGFILRASNPYSNGKSIVVLFSGCHAYGTLAATYYFTEQLLSRNKYRWINKNNFAAIVSAPVIDGWVPKPKLLHHVEWLD